MLIVIFSINAIVRCDDNSNPMSEAACVRTLRMRIRSDKIDEPNFQYVLCKYYRNWIFFIKNSSCIYPAFAHVFTDDHAHWMATFTLNVTTIQCHNTYICITPHNPRVQHQMVEVENITEKRFKFVRRAKNGFSWTLKISLLGNNNNKTNKTNYLMCGVNWLRSTCKQTNKTYGNNRQYELLFSI